MTPDNENRLVNATVRLLELLAKLAEKAIAKIELDERA